MHDRVFFRSGKEGPKDGYVIGNFTTNLLMSSYV